MSEWADMSEDEANDYIADRIDERRVQDAEDRALDERFMRERREREAGQARVEAFHRRWEAAGRGYEEARD